MSYYGPSNPESQSSRGHYGRSNANAKGSRLKGRRDVYVPGLPKPDDADISDQLFSVQGYSCILHRDDALAAYIDGEKYLELWQDSARRDLWIDRFDARALLDVYDDFCFDYLAQASDLGEYASEDVEERLLNEERYRDLVSAIKQAREAKAATPLTPVADGAERQDADGKEKHPFEPPARASAPHMCDDNNSSASCCSLPRSDEAEVVDNNQPPTETDAGEFMHLPPGLSVPEGTAVPVHKKPYDVLMFTAMRARKSGQLEVLLKLRCDQNPLFGFLKQESRFHPFYQYVKGLDDDMFRCFLLRETPAMSRTTAESKSTGDSIKSDALSMLCAYEDDEEYEHDDASSGHESVGGQRDGLAGGPDGSSDLDEQAVDSAYALIEALLNDPMEHTDHSSDQNVRHESILSNKQRDRLEKAKMLRDVYARSLSATTVHPTAVDATATSESITLNPPTDTLRDEAKTPNNVNDTSTSKINASDSDLHMRKRSRSGSSDRGLSRRSGRDRGNQRRSHKRRRRSLSRTPSTERTPELHAARGKVAGTNYFDKLTKTFAYSYNCPDNTVVALPFFIDRDKIRCKIRDLVASQEFVHL